MDSELTKLSQMGIPLEDALVLLSEEVIIMFERFHLIRRKRMDFTVKGAKVEYMVRCIWLTLQVHVSMDKFVRDGLKYNSAILAAFVRFLTKRTGSNVGSGFSGLISKLEEWVKSAEGAVKEAVKKANEATKSAASASTAADLVKTGLAKLYTNNSLLKK